MTMGSYHIDYRSPSAPFKGGSSFGPFWAYTMMYYFWWFFHYSRPNSLTMMVWMNFYDKKNIAGPLSVVIGSFRTLKDSEKWVYLVKIGIKSAEMMVLAEWPRWILGFLIFNFKRDTRAPIINVVTPHSHTEHVFWYLPWCKKINIASPGKELQHSKMYQNLP